MRRSADADTTESQQQQQQHLIYSATNARTSFYAALASEVPGNS